MGDNDILIGGQTSECNTEATETSIDTSNFLKKDQYLGEFSDEATLPDGTTFNEKAKARDNLDVYSRSEVEDMVDNEHDHMLQTVNSTMREHLEADDPHGSRAYTDAVAERQSIATTVEINTLKANLESLLNRRLLEFVKTNDFEAFQSQVLRDMALAFDNVYTKAKVYTKDEINVLNSQFVKTNGTTPFTKPQEGIEPVLDRHLATKRYVDNVFSHATDFLNNIEFRTWINQRLAAYAKLSDTYSRDTIDNKLENLVDSVVETAINKALTDILADHLEAEDPHGDRAYADGKFATKEEVSGLTKADVPELVAELERDRDEATAAAIKAAEPVWKTVGPVQTTVGYVEDDTDFHGKEFTLQGIMDAIFYGKQVQIYAPEEVVMGSSTDVTVTIHGSTETVTRIVIKQGDTVIAELEASDLDENGQATVRSLPIMEDTVFTAEVYYYGVDESVTAQTTVKVGRGVFIGLLPKYETASTVTWERLQELAASDPTNNQFFTTRAETITELDLRYNFESPRDPKHIFVAVPAEYPDIVEMATSSQQFTIDAFNVVNQVPLNVKLPNGEVRTMLYKYFVYKEALVTLSTKVTFKFN